MTTSLQSAVARLTVLCDNPTRPAVGLSVVDCADLRLVLDALAVAQTEIEGLEFELKNVQTRFDETP